MCGAQKPQGFGDPAVLPFPISSVRGNNLWRLLDTSSEVSSYEMKVQ